MTDEEFLAKMQRMYPRDVRVGKVGIVRFKRKAMDALRQYVFQRDRGRCVTCKVPVSDSLPDWHPLKYDLSHLKVKALHGDLPSQVVVQCHRCHMRHHSLGAVAAPILPVGGAE